MSDADEPAVQERPAKRAKISKAEAMMAKMGYVKGQGLGKNNDGVVTSLQVKRRRVPQGASGLDEEGGKVKSQQVWDVSGGERHKADEPGKFGEESCVVAAWGCTDGVDWDENAQRNDGGIRQEIGEVFSEKAGLSQNFDIFPTNLV
jgi:splicing factor 45